MVQVPDFGKRYWVYQATDLRTDGFADLGAMYGTKPGFYLLVGPGWNDHKPENIAAVFRSSTNIGTIIPRVFQQDDKADNAALQPLLQQILAYPLSEFDGTYKTKDWSKIPSFPWIKLGDEEWKWVDPATFFDVLPQALDAARPLPGEEALYALVRSVLDAAGADRSLRKALKDAAAEADEALVKPLLQFRNFGIPLPHNWTTVINSAEFGTDYFTRTAVAKSNIFINRPRETRYFYQDLDNAGSRLTGASRYTVTFHDLPPVDPRASGRSRSTTRTISSRRTRSTASRSAPRASSCATRLTARSSSMCRRTAPTTTRCRTGCRRRTMSSRFISAPIGRSMSSTKAAGPRRRWSPV